MAPELERGTRRLQISLLCSLKFPPEFPVAKFRFLCANQQGRLAQRTSTGWCTPTDSGWSWRRSFRATATSPCARRRSCRWHWASLKDRWGACRVRPFLQLGESTSTFEPTGMHDWCARDIKVTDFIEWITVNLDVLLHRHSMLVFVFLYLFVWNISLYRVLCWTFLWF